MDGTFAASGIKVFVHNHYNISQANFEPVLFPKLPYKSQQLLVLLYLLEKLTLSRGLQHCTIEATLLDKVLSDSVPC